MQSKTKYLQCYPQMISTNILRFCILRNIIAKYYMNHYCLKFFSKLLALYHFVITFVFVRLASSNFILSIELKVAWGILVSIRAASCKNGSYVRWVQCSSRPTCAIEKSGQELLCSLIRSQNRAWIKRKHASSWPHCANEQATVAVIA